MIHTKMFNPNFLYCKDSDTISPTRLLSSSSINADTFGTISTGTIQYSSI